jgi:hypothetical protein
VNFVNNSFYFILKKKIKYFNKILIIFFKKFQYLFSKKLMDPNQKDEDEEVERFLSDT